MSHVWCGTKIYQNRILNRKSAVFFSRLCPMAKHTQVGVRLEDIRNVRGFWVSVQFSFSYPGAQHRCRRRSILMDWLHCSQETHDVPAGEPRSASIWSCNVPRQSPKLSLLRSVGSCEPCEEPKDIEIWMDMGDIWDRNCRLDGFWSPFRQCHYYRRFSRESLAC